MDEAGMGARLRPRLVLVVTLLVGLAATPLHAQSGDLRGRARQVASEISALRSAGHFDAAAQQRAVDQLGQLVLAFIDTSDRAANSGATSRQAESLRATFDAIDTPLDEIYTQSTQALDRMARKVMDEDGDLEALYETQPFKDAQVGASTTLYYLNWLNYYGARVYDGARRKALLERAQRGFSEFATGDRRNDLLIESLLGRGLCYLELGDATLARRDLDAVIADPKASPERRNKARLALLDAAVQAGNTAEALRLSDEMLASGARGDENVVRFLRLRALMAAAKRGGADADRSRQQALALMEQLRRAGAGWDDRVSALLQTGVDNPAQWAAKATSPFAQWELARMLAQKNDYKAAAPLLEAVVVSDDPQVRPNRREAQYMLGLAKFQAGDYAAAATLLDAALQDGSPAYAADASYMRFKALEAEVAKQPTPEVTERYGRAIREFLGRYPEHRNAAEAHFRQGELLQVQRQFPAAIDAYAKVSGDPGLQVRARFATLQCQFDLLGATDGADAAAQRSARLEAIGRNLDSFTQESATLEKSAGRAAAPVVQPLRAKVAVMRAVYLKLLPGDHDADIVRTLAGFETTYADDNDLVPQVVRLRLEADQRLGRFTEAQAEVKAQGAVLVSGIGRQAVEELAVGFIREGARRRARDGDAVNDAAQKVALGLYEQLSDGVDGSAKTTLTLARLYENTGDLQKSAGLYKALMQRKADTPVALRGLARIAEAEKRPAEAIDYWRQFTAAVRPGDAPWYEGQYRLARLTLATGNAKGACDQLEALKPAMPGLSDVDLRRQLGDLYEKACR